MKKLIDIDESTLEKIEKRAKDENRPVKHVIEMILKEWAEQIKRRSI